MQNGSIEMCEAGIHVHDLRIPQKEIAEYLRPLPEAEREVAFLQVVEMGVYCLQRAQTSQETDFVRRQVESLLAQVERAVGDIPAKVEEQLITKLGCDNGGVLGPVRSLVREVSAVNTQRLNEVKDLLSHEIDPSKSSSTLGRALSNLKDLLNPRLDSSVQKSFENAVEGIISQDGSLALCVQRVVETSVRPLADEVRLLSLEIRGQSEADQLAEQTTLKGIPFELETLESLRPWARLTGSELEHVGIDNQPGDILVQVPHAISGELLRLIIEAKNDEYQKGCKAIGDICSKAMNQRNAITAIYVNPNPMGFAQEIGEWAEGRDGRGPWVATRPEHLITAIRYLVAEQQLEDLRKSRPEVDAAAVKAQVDRIRSLLKDLRNVKLQLTKIEDASAAIKVSVDRLKENVDECLAEIEGSLRGVNERCEGSATGIGDD